MTWLWEWFAYAVPWWLWAIAASAVVVASWRLLGSKGALAAAATLAAAIVYRKGAQKGWDDRAKKGERDVRLAIDTADRARADADQRNADPRRLRDDDGFRRD